MALMFASKYGHTNIVQLLLEHGANANLQSKVSSSAKIVCLSVCLTALHLAYSAIIIILCGCPTEVNSKVHKFSLRPYKGISLSVV